MADDQQVEMRDISPRALWLLGLCFGGFVALAAVGLLLFFTPDTSWTFNRMSKPEPRLQIAPAADHAAFAARQDAMLSRYGVPDPASSVVQVPIEEAMRLVSEGHRPRVDAAERQLLDTCAGAACPDTRPSAKTIR